jgi:hypothetical protein
MMTIDLGEHASIELLGVTTIYETSFDDKSSLSVVFSFAQRFFMLVLTVCMTLTYAFHF